MVVGWCWVVHQLGLVLNLVDVCTSKVECDRFGGLDGPCGPSGPSLFGVLIGTCGEDWLSHDFSLL